MPNNYRPIALTSHICKIMERMITDRLNYYLESRSGFRKGRSTTDTILCLESEIRKDQVNREIVAAGFLKLKKLMT